MPGTSTNRLYRFPVGGDAANVPADITNLANDLDNSANIFIGTLGARPAASAAAGHGAANPGSFWFATDTQELFVSIAGAWVKLTTEPGLPLGAMMPYAGTGDPADTRFLLAEGRVLARAGQYAPLFAVIGTAYNVGGEAGTDFRIPDKRGRVSIGADNMGTARGAAGLLPNTNKVIGQTNGEERHLLSATESGVNPNGTAAFASNPMSAYTGYPNNYYATALAGADIWLGSMPSNFAQLQARNADLAHNNIQPGQVDNYLIRVK